MKGTDSDPAVATLGEPLLVLRAPELRRLEATPYLEVLVGGAEINVAIGLARLGTSSAWCGVLPDDDFGKRVYATLVAERVDVSGVVFRPGRLGIMFVESGSQMRPSRVVYYRDNTAGLTFSREDLDSGPYRAARLVHASGISCAMGGPLADSLAHALQGARTRGQLVSFDLNYRADLWPPDKAANALLAAAQGIDVLFANFREARRLYGLPQDAPVAVTRLRELYRCKVAILKLGPTGAVAYDGTIHQSRRWPVNVLNRFGLGDAFAAGFLHIYLESGSIGSALDYAAAAAALKATIVDTNNPTIRRDLLEGMVRAPEEPSSRDIRLDSDPVER